MRTQPTCSRRGHGRGRARVNVRSSQRLRFFGTTLFLERQRADAGPEVRSKRWLASDESLRRERLPLSDIYTDTNTRSMSRDRNMRRLIFLSFGSVIPIRHATTYGRVYRRGPVVHGLRGACGRARGRRGTGGNNDDDDE